MLQPCLSMSSCVWMCIVMEKHYTGCQYSSPFVQNGWPCAVFLVFPNTLLMLLWSRVAWIPPSAHLSSPRKQLSSAFCQADIVCLNFFSLFGDCVCIHCFDYTLISTFTNETQVSSAVTRIMWLRNSSPSLWYCYKKSKQKPFSAFYVHLWGFWNPSCVKLVIAYPNCDNLVENSA
jgi:hypothetical protein